MKHSHRFTTGSLIFLLSLVLILFVRMNVYVFPTHQIKVENNSDIITLFKGIVITQKIIPEEDYLQRVDVLMGLHPRWAETNNFLIVTDENSKVLYRESFHSSFLKDIHAGFYSFRFKSPLKVGKGHPVYLNFWSRNGERESCLVIAKNSKTTDSKIFFSSTTGDDLMQVIGKNVIPKVCNWL